MTAETVFANARIVTADSVVQGSLAVRDREISGISEGTTVPRGAIDLGGDLLLPGLIELHTDNLERHIQPRPNVDWPHDAAIAAHDGELASCGITTVLDAMRVGSIPSGNRYRRYARPLASELLEMQAAGALRISHHLHLRAEICSETLLEELAEFGPDDRVRLLSLMDHTPGQRQFSDLSRMRSYLKGRIGMSDRDFEDHVNKLIGLQSRHGEAHEAGAVHAAARLGAALASHDDTTPEQVAVSAGYGVRLAEFPTTRPAAEACRTQGIAVMMGAPNLIRGASHSGNVSAQDLAGTGHLDIISSDYVPSALLTSVFLLAEIWDDLPRAVGTVTRNPAAAAGFDDRGVLAEGRRADIIRVATFSCRHIVRETWVTGRRVA